MSKPALYPRLIPVSTTSGRTGKSALIAALTQSAGVPPTAHAASTGTGNGASVTESSPRMVSFCDMPLHWVSGAATKTRPNGSAAAASRAMPSAPIPSSFAIRIVRFSIYHALPCFFLSAFYHETSPDSTAAGEKMRAAFRLYICARMW